MVGVQIEEEKQDGTSYATSGSTESLGDLCNGTNSHAHKLIQKHLKENKISGLIASGYE